jgi:small subunit ribosomal protein S3
LKQYFNEKFFNESINIIFISIKIKNSAQLLASFLAKQLSLLKRHNYFLVFLKRILSTFISHKLSKIKGIKILISGRFNGAPRAKSRLITVGFTPILTISKSIDYYETTCYTKNGTFGIKIWISPS